MVAGVSASVVASSLDERPLGARRRPRQALALRDFSRPELEAVAHAVDEEMFAKGQCVLREGLSGGGFFVILEGNASIHVDGEARPRRARQGTSHARGGRPDFEVDGHDLGTGS